MRPLIAILVLGAAPSPRAQTRPPDLAMATLEDLMNIEITSAARKPQRAEDVAAAVFVITQADIHQSGLTSVPELLRLAPGVQVARISSNKWAISARGFGTLFSNKLLVLIDGRSIYDRLNSGEFWESEDLVVDDIERIEVISGPGGATWGANSMNGVINIVTKTAYDSQGASVRLAGGTLDGAQGSARYGGLFNGGAYRVFTQWSDHGESVLADRTPAHDDWRGLAAGFRVDGKHGPDAFMVEGNASAQQLHSLFNNLAGPTPSLNTPPAMTERSDTQIANLLGRWMRTQDNGSSLQLQSYFDTRPRNDPGVHAREITADVDLQYHTTFARRHDIVAGVGYRFMKVAVDGGFAYSITPDVATDSVTNAFVQDEIALADGRVHVTLGSKLARDSESGWGLQPTARVMWAPTPRQRLWGAVSRALRTPAENDVASRINYAAFPGANGLPTVLATIGNPTYQTERVINTEVGYRIDIASTLAVDANVFVGRYAGLQTDEPVAPFLELTPGPPHLVVATQYQNLLDATTRGATMTAHWQPFASWKIDGSYNAFLYTPHLEPGSVDAVAAAGDANAPRAQWQLRSSVSVTPRIRLDTALFHVGALEVLGVPAYTRADQRVEIALTTRLSIAGSGQNLLDRAHQEFAGPGIVATTWIPRSLTLQLMWHP